MIQANRSINFGRALTTAEKADFVDVLKNAKEKCGSDGNSILIVHDACLPQKEEENTGIGHLGSETSSEFFDFMKAYTGVNTIKVLPQGETGGFSRGYSGSALSLGEHIINPQFLTTAEFGNLLDKNDIAQIVKTNTEPEKATVVNFDIGEGSVQNEVLHKAFKTFQTSSTPEVDEVKKRFDAFKKENSDWLEPKAIFKVLAKENNTQRVDRWGYEIDRELYNPDYDAAARSKRIEEIQNTNREEIEFYKFKQFLADEHLKKSKLTLNQKGLKLMGDCLIGFSKDEVWANPKAFERGAFIGERTWGLPALDYSKINDPNSPASKLLNKKVELFAKRYDAIRFDAGWCYIRPAIQKANEEIPQHISKGSDILEQIESTVKRVKGKDFDPKNLIYEVEADSLNFSPFNWTNGIATQIPELKNRVKVFSSTHMSSRWGSVNFLTNNAGLSKDEFVMMVGNHDPIPLFQFAQKDSSQKASQIPVLAKSLGLKESEVTQPLDFAKAKFAEIFTAKHTKLFYIDVFGRDKGFNNQDFKDSGKRHYKLSDSFEAEYHKALQDGRGLNIMDSMEKVFKAKGLDKKHPELYKSIVHFRDTLAEKGVCTEKEANETVKNPITKGGNPPAPTPKSKTKIWLAIGGAIALGGGLLYLIFRNKKSDADKKQI